MLAQVIKRLGYSKPIDFELGTVVKGLPDLEIELDADEGKVRYDKDLLYIPRNLTRHKRVMTMRKVSDKRFLDEFSTSSQINGTNVDDFEFTEVEVEYQDELKEGDRIMVVWIEEAMMLYIVDVVRYFGE